MEESSKSPELVRRRENRHSTIKSGRTIGEKRERLETKRERATARKKDKRKQAFRVTITVFGFLILIAILIGLYFMFSGDGESNTTTETSTTFSPTIEIVDEDAASGSKITSRMNNYIGQVEKDFRDLGYNPIKAVIPSGTIRQIYIYLDGYTGFIKLTVDRGSAVSAEDADRMIRYLSGQGIADFTYIDVRIEGKAFWK